MYAQVEQRDPQNTGHEQTPAVLMSLVLVMGSVVGFGIIYRLQNSENLLFDHWSWYVITGIQTFMAFLLPIAYPGYAVTRYTAGLGGDGPACRLEAFYINATMGMVLGFPAMATLDHLMFVFAPLVAVLGWMPFPQVQFFSSGLACVCGAYMALWIPTNIASETKDPAPFVMFGIFSTCSFFRVFSPVIGFQGKCQTALLTFNLVVCGLVLLIAINGIRRGSRATKSIALVNKICEDVGEGPVAEQKVWAQWPPGKEFPSGWWFEPLPFGNANGWPFGPWLTGPNSANLPQAMIDLAAAEMKAEIPNFFPLSLVLAGLCAVVVGLAVAALVVC